MFYSFCHDLIALEFNVLICQERIRCYSHFSGCYAFKIIMLVAGRGELHCIKYVLQKRIKYINERESFCPITLQLNSPLGTTIADRAIEHGNL